MRIIVENGLRDILTQRRIPSASAFARLMVPYLGKRLSTSQITRYMRDAPPAFDLKFIGAACSALRCLPTDLFKIRIECGPDDDLADLGSLPKGVDVARTTPTGRRRATLPRRRRGEANRRGKAGAAWRNPSTPGRKLTSSRSRRNESADLQCLRWFAQGKATGSGSWPQLRVTRLAPRWFTSRAVLASVFVRP